MKVENEQIVSGDMRGLELVTVSDGRRFILRNSGDMFLNLLSGRFELGGWSFRYWDYMNFVKLMADLNLEAYVSEGAYKIIERLSKWYSDQRDKKQNFNRFDFVGKQWLVSEPFADQWAAMRLLLSRQFAGNWDVMGAGKTFVSIACYAFLKGLGLARRALVLCVNSGKWTWYDEVKKHSKFVVFCAGNGTHKVLIDIGYARPVDFFILHYDALINEHVLNKLLNEKFDVVIIDEAHKIKNLSAKRSKAVLELIRKVNRCTVLDNNLLRVAADNGVSILDKDRVFVWCLTGTPVSERPTNAYTLLKILYGNDFDVSYRRFEDFFCIFKELKLQTGIKVRKIIGFRNCEHLARVLEPVSIGRRADELRGLPEKVCSDRFLELDERERTAYTMIKKGLVDELKKLGIKGNVKLQRLINIFVRLQEFLSSPAILGFEDLCAVKHEAVLEMLEEIDEPLLVWVIFRKGAELLYKLLCDNGYAVGLVYGGSDVEVVKRRVESGDIRVLVASVKKLGVSVDFLRAFRRAVYVDIPVSFTEYMQSQDRIARRGMGGSVFLHRLVVKDSLDSYICEILRRKEDMVRQVGAEVDEELEVDVDEFLKCI